MHELRKFISSLFHAFIVLEIVPGNLNALYILQLRKDVLNEFRRSRVEVVELEDNIGFGVWIVLVFLHPLQNRVEEPRGILRERSSGDLKNPSFLIQDNSRGLVCGFDNQWLHCSRKN